MVTVDAALLQKQFNDSITAELADYVLDGAINLLNTFGAGLTSLTGAAGTKTGTYTSAETGAIMAVAMQIYRENYKHIDPASVQLGGIGQTYSTTNQLLSFARQLAAQLSGRSFERT